MRRLLLNENITVDGRIEMLDDWFDPSPDGDVHDLQDATQRQGASSDAVLLGRQTFEDFRGYWPQHIDELAGALPRPGAEVRRVLVDDRSAVAELDDPLG